MSVEVTRLPSGLSVVTDAMPHLETASLGVWVGSGSRDEQPDEHGISHLLEHMAFKGTTRRTARQIAEEIEAVGGDLNAATSVENTAYYARVLKADVPLALDVLSDILADPTFDPEELQARAERHRAGDRRDRRRPGRSRVRLAAGDGVSRPAGRPLDPRHAGDGALVRSDALCAPIWRATTRLPTWWSRRPARSTTPRSCRGRAALCGLRRPAAPAPEPAQLSRRHARRGARSRAGPYRHRAGRAAAARSRASTACRCSPTCWAAGCRRACSRKCGRSAGLCYSIYAFHVPYADTGLFGALCRHGRSRLRQN